MLLAETWLQQAKEQGNVASIYSLALLYFKAGKNEESIVLCLKGIELRIYPCYILLIKAYIASEQEEKAIATCESTIAIFQNNIGCTTISIELKNQLAHLRRYGKKCNSNHKQSFDLYNETANAGSAEAQFHLCNAYAFGDEIVKKNMKRAKSLMDRLLLIAPDSNDFYYRNKTLLLFGLLHESRNEIKEAIAAFQLHSGLDGKYNLARLVVSEKMIGDKEEALSTLEEGSLENDTIALFYATYLMAVGNCEQSIAILHQLEAQGPFHILIILQLAIAYKYGFGVPQDEDHAAFYCDIINRCTAHEGFVLFCQGYIELFGLQGEPNLAKGFKLID